MLIKRLEDNLRIAEAENDYRGAARIRRSLEMLLKPHIDRAEKLFLPEQPSNVEYHVLRHQYCAAEHQPRVK